MSSKILLRRGTAAEWSSANPILGNGELGIETDTLKIKIGNGSSTWSQLSSYANVTPAQLTSQINSLISAAPSTLDTLNELAAAINNDASFSTTVNNLLTGKVSKSGGDTITASTASTIGLVIQGAASQTANLQQWKNSAGTTLGTFDKNGILTVIDFSAGAVNATWRVYATAGNSTITPMVAIGAASQTANLQEWKNSAGSVLTSITSSGGLNTLSYVSAILGINTGSSSFSGISYNGFSNPASAPNTITFAVKGSSGQTSDLQQWINNAGAVVAKVDINGSVTVGTNLIIGNAAMFATGGNYYNASVNIKTQGTGYSGLVVRGTAGQTANLAEWQDSNGTTMLYVSPDGVLNKTGILNIGSVLQFADPGVGYETKFVFQKSTDGAFLIVKERSSDQTFYEFGMNDNAMDGGDYFQWTMGQWTAPGMGWAPIQLGNNSGKQETLRFTGDQSLFWSNLSTPVNTPFFTTIYSDYYNANYEVTKWTPSNDLNVNVKRFESNSGSSATFNIDVSGYTSTIKMGYKVTIDPGATTFSYSTYLGDNSSANGVAITAGAWQTLSNGVKIKIGAGALASEYWSFVAFPTPRTAIGGLVDTSALAIIRPTAADKGLVIKAASSQTANLTEWQNSSGTVLASISSGGNLFAGDISVGNSSAYGVGSFGAGSNSTQQLLIANGAAGRIGLIVKGAASQTANLQEWQNSAGGILAYLRNDGVIYSNSGIFSQGSSIWAGGYVANTQLSVVSQSASIVGTIIRGAASQTANLQEWQNSASTVVTKVDASGNITATDYKLSNSLYNIKKTLKKTIDPAQNAIAGNTYDLFQIAFPSSLQGVFTMQVSIRNAGYGQSMSYTLPTTYAMDWLSQYAITNPFTNSSTWVDLTPITFAPRHLMTNDYLKFQARIDNNTIFFRIKLTGQLTSSPLFDVYIQHSEEFANSTVTELSSTGTDFTTSDVLPNFLSSKAGTTSIFNPVTITSSLSSTVPLVIKSATSQNANLLEIRSSGGGIISRIDSNGVFNAAAYDFGTDAGYPQIVFGGTNTTAAIRREYRSSISKFGVSTGTFHFGSNPDNANFAITDDQVGVFSRSAGKPSFIIKSYSSQTANLQEWQNSSGTVIAYVDPSGIFNVNNIANSTLTTALVMDNSGVGTGTGTQIVFRYGGVNYASISSIFSGSPTGADMVFNVGTSTTPRMRIDNNGTVSINRFNAGSQGLIVKAATSQTANIQEWQDSVGTVLAKVDSSGNVFTPKLSLLGANPSIEDNSGSAPYMVFRSTGIEVNTRATTKIGLIVKGVASQTADLQQWQQSDGTITSYIGNDGNVFIQNNRALFVNSGYIGSASFVTKAAGPTWNGIIVKGAASQTANLQEWQDSAGGIMARMSSNGRLEADWVSASVLRTSYIISIPDTGPYFLMSSTNTLLENRTSVSNINFIVKGMASQTGSLQEWQNSAGTVLAKVNATGALTSSGDMTITNGAVALTVNQVVYSPGYSLMQFGSSIRATNYSTTSPTFLVQGPASQTANLQEWQNSAGTVLTSISSTGKLTSAVDASINGVAFGLGNSSSASRNIAIGALAGESFGANDQNLAIGYSAGRYNYGANNVIIGVSAGIYNGGGGGSNNTYLGVQAGYSGAGSNNVMIGYLAGVNTAGDNKLVISNSSTATPLIGGDFSAKTLTVAGNASIISQATGTVGLIVKAIASQTNDLQQWQNSAGTVLAEVTASGGFELNGKDIELMNIMGAY